MKEQIYTIDINDAFDAGGCPICTLAVRFEQGLYEFILGPAMMEPDFRIQTNQKGFCNRHLQGLFSRPNKLGLGLVMESLLKEINQKPERELPKHHDTCYFCDRKNKYMASLADAVVYMWKNDRDFAMKWTKIEGVCLPHANYLANATKNKDIIKAVYAAAARRSAALQDSVTAFCQSFDYRNAGVDIGEDKYAVEQVCKWLGGTHG